MGAWTRSRRRSRRCRDRCSSSPTPPVVYNGITTQVTLYATSVTAPLVSVKLLPSGGGAAIDLTMGAKIDPLHPKRVLANVPKGTAAGEYDIEVQDSSGCPAVLTRGLKVVSQATVVLTGITPPFGWKDATTAVTITAQAGLQATPRAYLNPHTPGATTVATALGSVAFVSATKITAIVPKGVDPAANPYDVIVVNPDGSVGVLTTPDAALYRSTTLTPPVIDSITPGAVPNTQPPAVTLSGSNFRTPSVTFNCLTDVVAGTKMAFPATVSSSSATSITINNPPVGTLTAPSLCTIRVTNGDDMSFFDFDALAISNSSGNLSASKMTNKLPAARRAPAVAASFATSAARFIYAIGGDSGTAAGATSTVFAARADETGAGTWFTQRYALNANRTLAGVAALGRYLYVAGGNDGTGPVNTVERAYVLDPLEAPLVTDVDIVPGMGAGLGGGVWVYRVAAVMDATNPDNPGGETLPSDVFTLQLPDLAQKLQVKLAWSQVTGAVGYVIYRTPVSGKIAGEEELLATVTGGATLTFTDTGGTTDNTKPRPLVQGSTGKWRVLPAMGSKRESAGVVFGVDPADASKHYLYALLGKDAAALGSYEFLPVTVGAGGAQTFTTWTAGSKSGATLGTTARYQHAAYSASPANSSFVPAGKNYIYLGGGTANGMMTVQSLDVATVAAGGDLGVFAASSAATIKSFGSGYVPAANYLYTFGDDMPSTGVRAGQIDKTAPPAIVNFQNNGASLSTARYLPGVDLSGALIYVVGGSNVAAKNNAVDTVETFIW